jgi:Icc-related predicted phosphoesterase
MKILSLSDVVEPTIYSPVIRQRFSNIDIVIGCGDLPYYYQEFVASVLNAQLFFIRGNHDQDVEYSRSATRRAPLGGENLHRRSVWYMDKVFAGVEGSLRYRPGPFQYTQREMWWHVFSLVPALLRNKLVYGRYIDVFVTHAPPRGIHDKDDLTHQGIDAFRWFIKVFKPAYHFHGHIHVYRPDEVTESLFGSTQVINTFGHKETVF